jgi:hypothetical protein
MGSRMACRLRISSSELGYQKIWFRLGKTDIAEHIFVTNAANKLMGTVVQFPKPPTGSDPASLSSLLDALPDLLIGPRTGR